MSISDARGVGDSWGGRNQKGVQVGDGQEKDGEQVSTVRRKRSVMVLSWAGNGRSDSPPSAWPWARPAL